jgi:hypothetical protein
VSDDFALNDALRALGIDHAEDPGHDFIRRRLIERLHVSCCARPHLGFYVERPDLIAHGDAIGVMNGNHHRQPQIAREVAARGDRQRSLVRGRAIRGRATYPSASIRSRRMRLTSVW